MSKEEDFYEDFDFNFNEEDYGNSQEAPISGTGDLDFNFDEPVNEEADGYNDLDFSSSSDDTESIFDGTDPFAVADDTSIQNSRPRNNQASNTRGSNSNRSANQQQQQYQNNNQQGQQFNNQQQVNAPSEKKSSSKTIGIIIFVVLIILALFVSVISRVHVTKKPTSSTQNQQLSQTTVKVDEETQQKVKDLEAQVSELQSELKEAKSQSNNTSKLEENKDSEPTDKKASSNEEEVTDSENSIFSPSSWQEVDESSINFSGETFKANGVVKDKKVFLTDTNQLTYMISIDVESPVFNNKPISYYCVYNVYNSISVGDNISVKYQAIGKTASVVGLEK